MSFLARILRSFDEALDWPDDPFLSDNQPEEDWADLPAPRGASRSVLT
jgi:hypothetical protein